MKKWIQSLVLAALLVLLLAAPSAKAQQGQGTQVWWNASRYDISTGVATTVTSAATLTITPAAGQYVYITQISYSNCAGASAVTAAGPTSITSTNLNGATWQVGSGVTAGLCTQDVRDTFGNAPLKSAAAGTAVTVINPTFATNQTVRTSVYYYTAP